MLGCFNMQFLYTDQTLDRIIALLGAIISFYPLGFGLVCCYQTKKLDSRVDECFTSFISTPFSLGRLVLCKCTDVLGLFSRQWFSSAGGQLKRRSETE